MTRLDATELLAALSGPGFAFVPGKVMRPLLEEAGPIDDWLSFTASWQHLGPDTYMADGGRYRQRRHAVYRYTRGGVIARCPHQPHYQDRDYNQLNGGISRWFEPITVDVGAGQSITTILTFCGNLFGTLAPGARSWLIEVHQFRIEAARGSIGKPTPEGMHRDGVDYALVLLVNRTNIKSGTTTIADLDKRSLGSFTLTAPFDAALLDDSDRLNRVIRRGGPREPRGERRANDRDRCRPLEIHT